MQTIQGRGCSIIMPLLSAWPSGSALLDVKTVSLSLVQSNRF